MKAYWIAVTPFCKLKTKKPNIFLRIVLWLLEIPITYEEIKPYEAVVNIHEDPVGKMVHLEPDKEKGNK